MVEHNIENEKGILTQRKGISKIRRARLKLRKFVFTKTWKVTRPSQHLYLKIVGSMPESIPSNNI